MTEEVDVVVETNHDPVSEPARSGQYFPGGAYRDTAISKNDYEAFLSPLVLLAFGNYMTKHRHQSDGVIRDSDNWQLGIDLPTYMKSMWRHFLDVWALHRGYLVYKDRTGGGEVTHILANPGDAVPEWESVTMEEAICGLLFNVNGYTHEYLGGSPKRTPGKTVGQVNVVIKADTSQATAALSELSEAVRETTDRIKEAQAPTTLPTPSGVGPISPDDYFARIGVIDEPHEPTEAEAADLWVNQSDEETVPVTFEKRYRLRENPNDIT
jgi:hypothetical protein